MQKLVLFVCFVAASGCFSDPVGEDNENNDTNNACEPVDEVCDGEDNDCDGEIDEDFTDLGDSCSIGVGACESSGEIVCSDDGEGTQCDAEEIEPGEELCGDDVDNDCDEEVDEGFDDLGMSCTAGLGVCEETGEQVCSGDMLATECGATAGEPPESPDETTCDGLDNDCDGEVDEGCDADEDGWCAIGFTALMGGPCTEGENDCDDADSSVYPGAPGKCDGKDTNCDGEEDNILAVEDSVWEFDLGGDAVTGAGPSPILAAGSDTGFCIVLTGDSDTDLVRAHADVAAQTLAEDVRGTTADERFVDLIWADSSCFVLSRVDDGTSDWDARMERFDPSVADPDGITVVRDGFTHIQDNWDLTLTAVGTDLFVAYPPLSGSQAKYVTVPTNYANGGDVSAENDIGPFGAFGEAVPSPTGRDVLCLSNFFNVNVSHANLGSDGDQLSDLEIDSSAQRNEMVAQNVGMTTYVAIHHAGDDLFEIREVLDTGQYGSTGSTPAYATLSGQDYINRELFAAGILTPAMFADPIEDMLYQMSDDGTDIGFEAVGTSRGDLLTVRDAGDDVIQALWMLDPGTADSADDVTLEVVNYTCH
jgi:hypothetical protein